MKHPKLTHTIATLSIFGLALVGCSSINNDESQEQPVSESEQHAPDNIDTTDAVYEETYPVVRDHVIENYGITEQAELCQNSENYDDDFDYDEFIDNLMNEADAQVAADSSEDPEYVGAYDATEDAIYDLCEDYSS